MDLNVNIARATLQDVAQPFLHELVTCVHAPVAVLGGADGQIRGGAQGLHWLDRRRLSSLVVTVDGDEPTPVGHELVGPNAAHFVAALQGVGTDIADPTVRVERHRTARGDGMGERVEIVNDSRVDVDVHVELAVTSDLASVSLVKDGGDAVPIRPAVESGVARWRAGGGITAVRVEAAGAMVTPIVDGPHARFGVSFAVPARDRRRIDVVVDLHDESAPHWFSSVVAPWAEPVTVQSASSAFDAVFARGAADVAALLLADGTDVFAAAGSPWFLTLFGRDSIWTARFMLPFGTELAAGTLRALARRQATVADAGLSAEPGKMPHEVRLLPVTGADLALPPLYYGTIDATPLWMSLLHDAWRWGLPDAEVDALLDTLERAVAWLEAARDESGFLSYRDATGSGLANQGWKDSGDSVQDAAGRLADPPITLCEVQGYAHRALQDAAALLDAFGRPGGERARETAAAIATAFRQRFWVDGPAGRFPALALDAHGDRVDSLSSNIAHLVGTGLLDADEEATVAAAVADDRLSSGHGLRTLDAAHPHFNPLGYHSGSIWPHDTAIAVGALLAAGHGTVASRLARGLVDAGPAFDGRLPELFGGWDRGRGRPLAYPAACRPQAWSAAAPVAVLTAALGLALDDGALTSRPDPAFAWLFPMVVRGVRAGGAVFDVEVDGTGQAAVRRR